jgi:hypothetical protein
MRHRTFIAVVVAGMSALPAFSAGAVGSVPFAELSGHYEAIRLTLLEDSKSGVAEHARQLSEAAANLREDLAADRAGDQADDRDAFVEALAEIEASAARLAESADLEAAREELFVLTRPMAKYRKLTGDQTTIVAYCSMAQKAWIQPQGELGNPYMGQRMPRCGEVVGES